MCSMDAGVRGHDVPQAAPTPAQGCEVADADIMEPIVVDVSRDRMGKKCHHCAKSTGAIIFVSQAAFVLPRPPAT